MHTLKKLVKQFSRRAYIAYLTGCETGGYKIKVYARSKVSARIKAYKILAPRDMIEVIIEPLDPETVEPLKYQL